MTSTLSRTCHELRIEAKGDSGLSIFRVNEERVKTHHD